MVCARAYTLRHSLSSDGRVPEDENVATVVISVRVDSGRKTCTKAGIFVNAQLGALMTTRSGKRSPIMR